MQIVPVLADKPLKIAQALMSACNLPAHTARKITADIYGFDRWVELNAALSGPRDAGDERHPASVVAARETHCTAVLEKALNLSPQQTNLLRKALDPYGRNPVMTPDTEKRPLFDFKEGDFDRAVSRMLGKPVKNAAEQIRRIKRPGAAIWIDFLKTNLKFNLSNIDPDDSKPTRRIADTLSTSGETWEIYLTSAGYTPGDNSDSLIKDIEAEIAQKSPRALLIFYAPQFLPVIDDNAIPDENGMVAVSSCVLYGGRIHDGRAWGDFTFGPNGLDSVLSHKVRAINALSDAYRRDHTIPYGVSLAITLARNLSVATLGGEAADYKPTVMTSPRGWKTPVFLPKDANDFLKTMRQAQSA